MMDVVGGVIIVHGIKAKIEVGGMEDRGNTR